MSRKTLISTHEGLNEPKVRSRIFQDDGTFPNNDKLPVLMYSQAFDLPPHEAADCIEEFFESNQWGGIWRGGINAYHHYHSTSHEVLACYSGSAYIQLGGPTGTIVAMQTGDAMIIPAGVALRTQHSSPNFRVVAAYPRGQDNYDIRRGLPGERPKVDDHISQVPLPRRDPIYGSEGPMISKWLP